MFNWSIPSVYKYSPITQVTATRGLSITYLYHHAPDMYMTFQIGIQVWKWGKVFRWYRVPDTTSSYKEG